MFSFSSLAAVIFAISFAVSTLAAPFSPEPIFLFNLTREEFMHKRSEHRITKREFVLEEYQSQGKYMNGQRVLEALSEVCAQRFGAGYRCYRGTCAATNVKRYPMLDFHCNNPSDEPHYPSVNSRHASRACARGQTCDTFPAVNYAGKRKLFPYCKDTMKINKRPAAEVEVPPRFEGQASLPNPEETWQISDDLPSPGTIDTVYHMADHIAGLQASWEYRGHWENGWNFITGSKGMASSFSCLGCPKGVLYAETVGFKSQAEGFTLPHIASPWNL